MTILVTGCAGFIGFHLALQRLASGDTVYGVDNLNDYYDVGLKQARLDILKKHKNFNFSPIDISDREATTALFNENPFDKVVNLAAQAGVRYSLVNPHAYIDSNVIGFMNILEGCRHSQVKHLVYASSSSVYGANTKQPFAEDESVDHPIALYAATKKANELMAHSYSHLYNLPTTGLRFFTAYGPWGRPDMALFLFTKNILEGKPIKVFNYGQMVRDFTYIDDIVAGISLAIDKIAEPDPSWDGNLPNPATSKAPYRIYNIGNNNPRTVMQYIAAIEESLGKKAIIEFEPIQPGDVPKTEANINRIKHDLGYQPTVDVTTGVDLFVNWYLSYYC
ncbi:NAD-dependent epimerase [Legionella shakespearei]|uniref:Protein capI n=1 Tax=Legionella shakespearei DSM 23087 TaxID=1122169 RepID=A0A0W0YV22_9GAMM|nr:NAD-dependent epimerase [Legionella shakespearei]KTD60716.1 protein capI [Legionella shakespearei DSM 23087]